MSFTLDPASGVPGDTLKLTIRKTSGDPTVGAEPFVLVATRGGRQTLFWAASSD
jgi:hypothetical protein